jgi:hypothetical protein
LNFKNMKKIIGILGVAVIAATLFFSTDVVNSTNTDTTLGSLIVMNTANADETSHIWGTATGETCKILTFDSTKMVWNPDCNCLLPTPVWTNGSHIGCPGWALTGCSSTDCK